MDSKSKIWYLERFNLMKKMSKAEKLYMQKAMVMKKVEKGTFLYFPDKVNKYIYFAKTGSIKIVNYTEDGQEDIKCIIGPGNIFGELGLVGEESPRDFAIAISDCLICFVDVATMQNMMDKNKALKTEVHKIMGLRIKKLERRLESIIFKDSKTRIIEYLQEFREEYGKAQGNQVIAKNFLTHADIAKLTATSRQTVTTVFNELRERGFIDYNKYQLTFLNEKLIQMGQ